ncbi:MAG: hypothetical protein RL514_1176 [Verrucomicrobiota bacterium]|jgi:hypothetical protein
MKTLRLLLALLCLAAFHTRAGAALTPGQTQQAAAEIDSLLASHWKSAGVTSNASIRDETFVRRIYLDLAGRIPTASEARAFLDSKQPDKRAGLIDDLLARESYVSHFYNFWADILRLKSHFVNTANVVPAAYAKFIKESLRTNKPYDQFVRELLSARGYAWDNGAVGYYGRDPEMPLDNMAITTRIFLGTRIECAQCHDHPFDKWKQTEFYHLAAYTYGNKLVHEAFSGARDAIRARQDAIQDDFKKEKAASTDGGKAAEQRKQERLDAMEYRKVVGIIKGPVGQLFSPIGLERKADAVLKLPFDFHQADGKPGDVMRPRPIFGTAPELKSGDDAAEAFARWMTSPENPRFTRVIVNRLWRKLFGVALTEPLDDLRDGVTAMVPTVEERLTKLLVELRYDQKAFLAVVANTRAYQSAVTPGEFNRGEETYHFTGPVLRRMTAEQVWDSLVALASHEPDARDLTREARDDRRIQVSRMACDAYLNFDGTKLVDMAYARLQAELELQKRDTALKEALIVAKRAGDKRKEIELRHQEGDLDRERGNTFVKDFIMPILTNLAQKKAGPDAKVAVDETYKMNPNPRVLPTETWKRLHVPGYGPAPKTAAQLAAEVQSEKQRLAALALKLGYTEKDSAGFVAYCEKAGTEWRRASELDSPAPRGHFLRTMGQSDRDFVENANPNPAIPQALALMNGELISPRGLLSPYSPVMHGVERAADKADAAFLALLSRAPTPAERARLAGAAPADLLHALLNTKQFLFIQ